VNWVFTNAGRLPPWTWCWEPKTRWPPRTDSTGHSKAGSEEQPYSTRHRPLYRQEQIYWDRHQVWLPRQSMARWVQLASEWLKPIYWQIKDQMMRGSYIQVDETPIKYLDPARGGSRSADAVQHMVVKHVAAARQVCPSLAKKRVTPHVLRHTAAMELLPAGVDRSLIAIRLGHGSLDTKPSLCRIGACLIPGDSVLRAA
jgi:hypothetical protein